MKPTAYITHSAPGRYRLRIPDKRHDQDFFAGLEPDLAAIEGVERIVTNPVTASVLVMYSDAAPIDNISEQLAASRHFSVTTQARELEPLWQRASRFLGNIDSELTKNTSGYVDGRSLLFVVLVMLAIRQLQRGSVFGPAFSLLWFASQLLNKNK
jgi:hypothetical protein